MKSVNMLITIYNIIIINKMLFKAHMYDDVFKKQGHLFTLLIYLFFLYLKIESPILVSL